ncbi:hypothetical protein M0802_001397 [Mischocyttarus mexicanus]|nr:hypothetical protein M0802_001397 [Mischocyttarus mexicanus]
MDLAKNGSFFEAETIKSRAMAKSQYAREVPLYVSYNELYGNSSAGERIYGSGGGGGGGGGGDGGFLVRYGS